FFTGIKSISRKKFKGRAETLKWIDKFRVQIGKLSQDEILTAATEQSNGYSFLLVVQQVDVLVSALESDLSDNFNSDPIITTPSHEVAKELVTCCLGIHKRKIDEALASDAAITWPLPDGSVMAFWPKPSKDFLRLDKYPPIAKILRTK